MQSVDWDDNTVPPVFVLDNGDVYFFDRPSWNAFAVGDQIVHYSEIGPSVYRVVEVKPYYEEDLDYYGDPNRDYTAVTIRGV